MMERVAVIQVADGPCIGSEVRGDLQRREVPGEPVQREVQTAFGATETVG